MMELRCSFLWPKETPWRADTRIAPRAIGGDLAPKEGARMTGSDDDCRRDR